MNGTGHDVPSVDDCLTCHRGEPGRALGFSAVQLSHHGAGATLETLASSRLLSHPPVPGTSFAAPGDPVTAAALGYLHANCAHCHNPSGMAWAQTSINLRLTASARRPEETPTWQTAVDQPVDSFRDPAFVYRIRPGFPEESAVWHRMGRRDPAQMPPLGTEEVDEWAVDQVAAWIRQLR